VSSVLNFNPSRCRWKLVLGSFPGFSVKWEFFTEMCTRVVAGSDNNLSAKSCVHPSSFCFQDIFHSGIDLERACSLALLVRNLRLLKK
jgi:hypothetical protein